MLFERRVSRSRFKDAALKNWLEAVAQRQKVPAIVVADEQGELLVSSGIEGPAAEELAAVSAKLSRPDFDFAVTTHRGNPLVIRHASWEDEKLLLCVPDVAVRGKQAIQEVLTGVDRILNPVR
jgi:hypothetical protein